MPIPKVFAHNGLIVLGLLAGLLSSLAPAASGSPARQGSLTTMYLPSLLVGGGTVMGQVVSSRGSVAGHAVALFLNPGTGPSTEVKTVLLGNDGRYMFANVPVLTTGQSYWVGFFRLVSTPDVLSWADESDIPALARHQTVDLGTLDVTGLDLGSPVDGATVSMPTTFTWTPRPTTSDSYAWRIGDPSGNLPGIYTDELGYVSGVTIVALPPGSGYVASTQYVWGVYIWMPDGSIGASVSHWITFSNILYQDLVQGLRTFGEMPPEPPDLRPLHRPTR